MHYITPMQHVTDSSRAIIAITGEAATGFLQSILTQDIHKLTEQKIQFAALLSPQGKILHDMFVVADGARILLDTAQSYKDILLKRLAMYKLRAAVSITDISAEMGVSYTDEGLADPRHPELPRRHYAPAHDPKNLPPHPVLLTLGIPTLGHDFMPDEVVPLDAGYDLLNAISFTKGCYVGQEVTARMHYKNIARRGFYILESDLAAPRLALLKFADMQESGSLVTLDGITYHAHLPAWMQAKLG